MKDFQTKKAPHALKGEVTIPGDKSISHRAIMLSAIAEGITLIYRLLESDDVMSTIAAFRNMGVNIQKQGNIWHVHGVGLRGLKKPSRVLDMGNSGTSARLIMGILAGQDFEATITGDESLCKRPMKRITEPLTAMGASFEFLENDGCLPIKVHGNPNLKPLENYEMPVASAQIKSAILLAGLYADGTTSIIEKELSRTHTERMMQQFGVVGTESYECFSIDGGQILKSPANMGTPSDPSSAAFFIAASLMVPNSELVLKTVSNNPTRNGFLSIVKGMGGDCEESNSLGGPGIFEGFADLTIRSNALKGCNVGPLYAPSMIDEYPILAVLAAGLDNNESVYMYGIGELRFKESDRIAAMEEGLKACGVSVTSGDDWMQVVGRGRVSGGARVKTYMDHRIAMSFIILGLIAENPIVLDDVSPIMTSFPTFFTELKKLGVDFGL